VLYNTIYTQRALDQLVGQGYEIQREHVRQPERRAGERSLDQPA